MRSLFASAPRRFFFLLSLSIVIAVMGLSLDSPAVVIGAMLIAPLMTPVIAFAAALAMGWPRWMARSGAVILVSSAGSVGLAWLLAAVLPTPDLGREVLSRTSPDARDLLVAMAAGAAGAYATVREDLSAALPGVAVAVALVPPLAALGVVFEAGRHDLAAGAALLYAANLVAIVMAGVAVLLATGFVPVPHLARVRPRVVLGLAGLLGALVLIGAPLTKAMLAAAEHAVKVRKTSEEVTRWLESAGPLEATGVTVDGSRVVVELVGSEPPPPANSLVNALADDLGKDVEVELRWSQRTLSTVPNPDGDREVVRDVQEEWQQLVEAWLAGLTDFDVLSIRLDGPRVTVDVAGPVPPPDADHLAALAADRLGQSADVTVHWIERHAYRPTTGRQAELGRAAERARAVASAWTRTRPGLDVVRVDVADGAVNIDIAGEQAPEVAELVALVKRELGSSTRIVVRFSERRRLFPPT